MAVFFDKKPTIEGFDTETYEGDLLIICSSSQFFEFDPLHPIDLITWLFENSKQLNFFYNLRFDFSVILKQFLTMENKKEVREMKELTIDDYVISFIDKKFFGIKKKDSHKPLKRFYDIAQFYKGKDGHFQTLENVSQHELGEGKNNEELGIDRKSIGTIEGYYESHRILVIKYCIRDALLTKKLSEKRLSTLSEIYGGKYPRKYYSSASISKAYLEMFHSDEANAYYHLVKTLEEPMMNVGFNYISATYHGGVFYDVVFGKSENVSELDIKSAYPDKIRHLKSIIGADIQYTSKYQPDADYGFYKVKMMFTSNPFPFRHPDKYILYPESTCLITNYLTIPEIEWLKQNKIPVQIIDGFVIHTDGEKAFPDYDEIYNRRAKEKKAGNDSLQWTLKTIMNASYGCFAEATYGLTKWTNFIYASYITALTRLQLLDKSEELRKAGCQILAYRTDAIYYSGNYHESSDKFGEFELQFTGCTMYSYMSGFSIVVDAKGNTTLSKRGFPNIKASDLLNAHGDTLESKDKERPVSLISGIAHNRIDDIGSFESSNKSMRLKSLTNKHVIDPEQLTFEFFNSHQVIPHQIPINIEPKHYRTSKTKYNDWIKKCKRYEQSS